MRGLLGPEIVSVGREGGRIISVGPRLSTRDGCQLDSGQWRAVAGRPFAHGICPPQPWGRRTAMTDRIRRDQDDIDFDDENTLPDEGGGVAEAMPDTDDEDLDEDV